MKSRVKSNVAENRKKRRYGRVKQNKNAKADATMTPAQKERFQRACDLRHQQMTVVLRALAMAYADAVEAGRSTDGELEVWSKGARPAV